jgi:hypothetical protein
MLGIKPKLMKCRFELTYFKIIRAKVVMFGIKLSRDRVGPGGSLGAREREKSWKKHEAQMIIVALYFLNHFVVKLSICAVVDMRRVLRARETTARGVYRCA